MLNSKGFTLVEIMIVVAIVAILSAVAIPKFNEYRAKSSDATAQADVRNAMFSFTASMKR